MCNPAFVVMGMSAIGGAVAASGARSSGAASNNYYNAIAASNDRQAQEVLEGADLQAGLIQDSAGREGMTLRNQAKRLAGTQKAVQAANGVWGDSVTAEDIARDTMTKEELDNAALRFNADSKVWETMTSAKNQARALRDQAGQNRYAGANAVAAGKIAATTSLLSGATSVADQWFKWNQTSALRTKKKTPTGSNGYASARDFDDA